MRIIIFDPYAGKFTSDMQRWWLRQGHEVIYSNYYNPELVPGADVIWFETTDNNILSATNPSEAILADSANFKPWDIHEYDLTNTRVICRMIDIEVWQQHYAAVKWDVIDDIIFIAPHIRNLVDLDTLDGFHPNLKVHTIPCGVDLDRYTFKERGPGFDIAVISEKWCSKGTDLVLQVALKLQKIDPRYKLHWLGQWGGQGQWEQAYFTDFVDYHNLNIEFTNILNDGRSVNDFLEGKNYLLHGSKKEGFSYATAEAMAKGIKPVIHRFYGADGLWPGMTWDSIDEAVQMITEDNYDSSSYKKYLADRGYTLPQMMSAINKVIGEKT